MKEYRLVLTDKNGVVLRMWYSDLDFVYPIQKAGKDQLADEINHEIGNQERRK